MCSYYPSDVSSAWGITPFRSGVYFYVLGSLELIAEEIEDPFGKDANDLPMQRICENIRRNVEEILLKPVA